MVVVVSEFDPIKSAREELGGLVEAEKQLALIASHKEAVIDEAQHERDGLLKAVGLLRDMIKTGKANIARMEAEAEAKAKGDA